MKAEILLTSEKGEAYLKQAIYDEFLRKERGASGKIHKKHARNYTPPKKKRK